MERPAMGKQSRISLVSKEDIACPDVAYPTLLIFILGVTGYVYILVSYWSEPKLWTVPVHGIIAYVLFTPAHDAAHRAVSPKYRWLNEFVGWVATLAFLSPFSALRVVHLQHHKYTNDPMKDPDHWSAVECPSWQRPLRFATQVPYYYYWYLGEISTRPLVEALVNITVLVSTIGLISYLFFTGQTKQALYLLLFPSVIGEVILAYTFDYVPHHDLGSREDNIYACTSMVSGYLHPDEDADLTYPMLAQNYHVVHHLYPMVPFYRYSVIWMKYGRQLQQLGTPLSAWFTRSIRGAESCRKKLEPMEGDRFAKAQ